jgi:hypothetical protein
MNPPPFFNPVLENWPDAPQAVLLWQDQGGDETNYLIERTDSTNFYHQWMNIAILGQNVVTYTDTDIVNGVSYLYRIRGFRDTGIPPGEYGPYSFPRALNVPSADQPPELAGGGVAYGIECLYGRSEGYNNPNLINRNTLIVNNDMSNNGLGNVDSDFAEAPNITIDNPSSDSFQVRREVVITP